MALNTGRTKNCKGVMTCCLLAVLGVDAPKSPRTRMESVWAILDSDVGRLAVGVNLELDVERKLASVKRLRSVMQ